MNTARLGKYGETSPHERDTLSEIIFMRETRQLSYQKIADELNAQSLLPRRGAKWSWILVRYHYLNNVKPGSKGTAIKNEDQQECTAKKDDWER